MVRAIPLGLGWSDLIGKCRSGLIGKCRAYWLAYVAGVNREAVGRRN